ncbi:MAG: N(4)-(beta-N-acetylglucosaminyl)-L-asparaginase [Planctomycetota bacterium]
MSTPVSRRGFLKAAAVGAAATSCSHVSPRVRPRAPVAISSRNGIHAVEIAVRKMSEGLPPVDAAVVGIEGVENDPNDTSVGYGGLPNEEGVVELDACTMDGPSGLAGAVASIRNIKNPSQVALKVMRRTDHVLLVGEGALRFARAHGFQEENLLTERARRRWLRWKEGLSTGDDWIDPSENGSHGKEHVAGHVERPTGTIHVGCVNDKGDIGGCTSTSGLAFKIPGRVGDSPLIGCGNYVDNDYGVAGSTGRGEAVILSNGAARIVRYMAEGRSPTDACLDALRDIARMTRVSRLLDAQGRPNFQVNFYAINKAGQLGAAAMRPSQHSRMTENGPEVMDSAALFES